MGAASTVSAIPQAARCTPRVLMRPAIRIPPAGGPPRRVSPPSSANEISPASVTPA